VLQVDRSAQARFQAPRDRCLEVLGDVADYPRWSRLVRAVSEGDRGVHLVVEVLGRTVAMDCSLELGPDGAVLRRLPNDPGDDEVFVAEWKLADDTVTLHVSAAIDLPGAAGLLRGRIERRVVDELLDDFVAAV
jgi:hypothetical protein